MKRMSGCQAGLCRVCTHRCAIGGMCPSQLPMLAVQFLYGASIQRGAELFVLSCRPLIVSPPKDGEHVVMITFCFIALLCRLRIALGPRSACACGCVHGLSKVEGCQDFLVSSTSVNRSAHGMNCRNAGMHVTDCRLKALQVRKELGTV